MAGELSIKRLGQALGLFFGVIYLLCVAWDAIFPAEAMRSVWGGLLPGWDWLGAGDFFLGLAETYLYGWIAAVIFVPIWRFVGGFEGALRAPKAPSAPSAPSASKTSHGRTAHAH